MKNTLTQHKLMRVSEAGWATPSQTLEGKVYNCDQFNFMAFKLGSGYAMHSNLATRLYFIINFDLLAIINS